MVIHGGGGNMDNIMENKERCLNCVVCTCLCGFQKMKWSPHLTV